MEIIALNLRYLLTLIYKIQNLAKIPNTQISTKFRITVFMLKCQRSVAYFGGMVYLGVC